jgi:putative Mg2+ transporter-C (MgtC) family protein
MIWWETVLRILASMVIGGLIGTQREFKGNSAGLRTHTLVSLGACIAMLTNEYLFRAYSHISTMDIARMGSYVITGIGFLGAGSIIKDGFRVRGLTTAAGLWVVACLGIAVGAGFYLAAGVGTALSFITIWALKVFERRFINLKKSTQIIFQAKNSPGKLAEILNEIGQMSGNISNINFENSEDKWMDVSITVNKILDKDITSLAGKMEEMKGVKLISIDNS